MFFHFGLVDSSRMVRLCILKVFVCAVFKELVRHMLFIVGLAFGVQRKGLSTIPCPCCDSPQICNFACHNHPSNNGAQGNSQKHGSKILSYTRWFLRDDSMQSTGCEVAFLRGRKDNYLPWNKILSENIRCTICRIY